MVNTVKPGILISALGLPCTGKTTVLRCLGDIIAADAVYLEPEENEWPLAVKCRNQYEYFSCLMWFRSMRVPMLYEAMHLRNKGQTVLLDSYYDKIMKYYIGKKGAEWLITKNDCYFPVLKKIAALDWNTLPNADCIIIFTMELQDWITLLKRRNRTFDQMALVEQAYQSQQHFVTVADKLARIKGIKCLIFEQSLSSPEMAARRLARMLISHKIIDNNQIIEVQDHAAISECICE